MGIPSAALPEQVWSHSERLPRPIAPPKGVGSVVEYYKKEMNYERIST